jgi:hypothetical protein
MMICQKSERHASCDNCNKESPLMLHYKFFNKNKPAYLEIYLCEDCSCGLSNLHRAVMENMIPHQFNGIGGKIKRN